MATDIETSNAIIYGLLAQEEPLTRDDMRELQTQLKSQGIDTGKVDGFVGKNTAGAISEFLQSPSHRDLVGQLSDGMRNNLNRFGQQEVIDRIELQNNIADVNIHHIDVLNALDNGSLSRENMSNLQVSLNKLGYDTGGTKGIFGENTAGAIVDYLGDNLGAIATIEPSILLEAMKNGYTSELKELMNKPELQGLIDNRISEALDNIDDLATTTDHQAVYDLQTLLSLGGYAPGGIDGIVGNKTLSAVDRHDLSQAPDVVIPNPKPEAITPTAKEFNGNVNVPQSKGLLANGEYSAPINGDNGYGVSNLQIEKAWAKVTATNADDAILSHDGAQEVSLASNLDPLIVIDLGHGADFSKEHDHGNDIIDNGAISKHVDGLTETAVVDPVGQSLAEQLREQGYNVVFTRNPGEQLRLEGGHSDTLEVRSDFANQLAADVGANGVLLISLHLNSFTKENVHGARVYHDVDGANNLNSNSVSLANNIAKSYSIGGKTSSVSQRGDLRVLDRFENYAGNEASAATLVELGFLSNEQDAQALKKMGENPEIAAGKIAKGIDTYVHPEKYLNSDMNIKQDATAPAPLLN